MTAVPLNGPRAALLRVAFRPATLAARDFFRASPMHDPVYVETTLGFDL